MKKTGVLLSARQDIDLGKSGGKPTFLTLRLSWLSLDQCLKVL
jgi:hypothetical protein